MDQSCKELLFSFSKGVNIAVNDLLLPPTPYHKVSFGEAIDAVISEKSIDSESNQYEVQVPKSHRLNVEISEKIAGSSSKELVGE